MERINMIPGEITEVFDAVHIEIYWLHSKWYLYRELFGKDERRFEFLIECAPQFFGMIHNSLLNEVLLSLNKLRDPSTMNKRENLSLHQLHELIKKHGDPQLEKSIARILTEFRKKCEPLRTLRNRKLAHLDLSSALGKDLLPGTTQQSIEEILENVRNYINKISSHYNRTDLIFPMERDGEKLVRLLKMGIRYNELVVAESIPLDDLDQGNWSDA